VKQIFVNLKRFDVPKEDGGLCPVSDPVAWIESVIRQSVELNLGGDPALQLVYLLPEGLVAATKQARQAFPSERTSMLGIGCQGVHWDNVAPGKNFGAFTSAVPAAAVANLGCTWAIIGHSEERHFKSQVIEAYDPAVASDPALRRQAQAAIDRLVHAELQNALNSGLNVLLCVGESAEERGGGSFAEQQPRIQAVLKAQLLANLAGLPEMLDERQVVIGYEPIWAIGPGKTPPGSDYIGFVSTFIREVVLENFDIDIHVVYGGGLKKENAAIIAGIPTIAGGLIALTRFSGEIGFDIPGLKEIVEKYLA
jgi:triosephosphate isomerase